MKRPQAPDFGIAAGAYWLPPARRELVQWARAVGAGAQALLPAMRANGLAHYHVATGMTVEDLSCAAVQALLDGTNRRACDVDLVLFCHTNTTSVMAAPASLPALLMKRFGMHGATGWSISQQNCASIVCALRLLRTLMWRNSQLNEVLIVSTDKVFAERFRNVSSYAIQTDGSLALWISRDHLHNRISHIAYAVDGCYYKGSAKGAELGQRFALNYPLRAHQMMFEVMQRLGWQADDVDAVLPMNANLTAFSKVMSMLGMPADKLHAGNIGRMGHVFCCDPFINFLQRFACADQVRSGNAILFASASSGIYTAVGLSRAWTGPIQQSPWREPLATPAHAAAALPDLPCADRSPRATMIGETP